MSKYVQATRFRVKEGQLDAAQAELQRWMAGFKEVGAEMTIYLQVGGPTGEAMVSVEYPDGETWLKVQEDPRLLEARRAMTEPSWPFAELNSTLWQELAADD